MPSERHDPKRFYHCDCLESGSSHDDRFYHCDCLEGGYDPSAAEVESLRAEVERYRAALERIHRGEQPAHKIAADALTNA